ncbi:MAG: glycosyltransferase [Coriobacteriales bacterium]|jgi:glycosyltransferase involved in cell wall biosynthesis
MSQQRQSEGHQPIVSVIVPAYNNEHYVVACVRSLLAQTLEDIEVICVNDGSTDNTSQVLHAFADADPRVRVIDKENGGYGVAINRGIDEARGRYVTILESDDFADLDMLETLVGYADAFDLDVARANFYLYWSGKLRKDIPLLLFSEGECDRVIDPSVRKNQHCFYVQPALWSAIYRASFLRSNGLRLLETPGAAYQDTAFNFKVWACARRVMFVHTPFVHYRQDNESSSINNPGKVYNICLEYHEADRWLTEDRPDLRESLAPVKNKMMCDAYTWNTRRVSDKYKLEFVEQFGRELKAAEDAGEVDPSLFAPGQYEMCQKTITDPQGFIDFHERGVDPDHGLGLYRRKMTTMAQVWAQRGAGDVMRLLRDKLTRHRFEPSDVDRADAELILTRDPQLVTTAPEAPEVSVVMPVYNCVEVLGDTLDSVLSQSLTNFELICVDDGSTDGSSRVLAEYAAKDARIRVITQANAGAGAARNAGMAQARAPYLMLLDSDDVFDYRLLQRLHDRLAQTGADVAVCGSCEFTTGDFGSRPTPWTLKTRMLPPADAEPVTPASLGDGLFLAFLGWPWDRMFRTDFVRSTGIRFPSLANSEDGPFVYETLASARGVATVREVLIRHRVARSSSVSNSRLAHPEEFYRAIVMVKDFVRRDPALYAATERSLLNWALDFALWNVTTLPEGAKRRELALKLLSGGYPEIELDRHPQEYFDLLPEISTRMGKLKAAYEGR